MDGRLNCSWCNLAGNVCGYVKCGTSVLEQVATATQVYLNTVCHSLVAMRACAHHNSLKVNGNSCLAQVTEAYVSSLKGSVLGSLYCVCDD